MSAKLKTYALLGFSSSGRCNIICITQAVDDYTAAAKLGGELIELTQIPVSTMEVYACRLPPSPSGVAWSEFRFKSVESIQKLAEREPKGTWLNTVKNVVPNSDHLVLAEVPFLEDDLFQDDLLDMPIHDFFTMDRLLSVHAGNFHTRIHSCLGVMEMEADRSRKVKTVRDFITNRAAWFWAQKNSGRKTLLAVRAVLATKGLAFAGDEIKP